MTPADRDAAVALARAIAEGSVTGEGVIVSDGLRVGPLMLQSFAHTVLALAERPACATCRWWTPAKARGAGHGFCDNAGSPAHNYETTAAWFCADYQAADHSENILDMVGTCKDSLRVDRPADAKEGQ